MSNIITSNLKNAWHKFRSGDLTSRNLLIEGYLPLVRITAERLHAKLVNQIELDDLVSSGIFGLIDAINSFDPNRGVKFETFSVPRIRGAMLDELRRMDWVPRLVRASTRKLNNAIQIVNASSGQKPTDEELAARMGTTIGKTKKMLQNSFVAGQISLDYFYSKSSENEKSLADTLEDQNEENPHLLSIHQELKDIMTNKLSRTEKLVIMLYHYEGMTMKEIGSTLDLSESRVSQIYTELLVRLRGMLEGRQKSTDTAA